MTSTFLRRLSTSFRFCAAFVAAALATLLAPQARADVTASINSLTITNYTGYIISSDTEQAGPQYNRDHIAVEASVSYFKQVSTNVPGFDWQYLLAFQLVDTNGVPQPLLDNGNTNTEVTVTYEVNRSGTFIFFLPVISDVNLTPATPLDPLKSYSVTMRLYRRPWGSFFRFSNTGLSSTTSPQQYLTFPDLNGFSTSADAATKAYLGINSRVYMITGSPTENTFQVNVLSQLFTYRAWNFGPFNYDVTVRYELQLFDAATMQQIPITQTQFDIVKNVPNVDPAAGPGLAQTPHIATFVDSLQFAPAPGTQLDPLTHQYFAVVSIGHLENPGDFIALPGNQISTSPSTFIQLSGKLQFGDIATTFTDVDTNNPPAAGIVDGLGLHSTLAVDQQSGEVSGLTGHTYGDGTKLDVAIQANGDAVLLDGGENLTLPAVDLDTENNVAFFRTGVNLSTNGAFGNLLAVLPTGFGYSLDPTNRILEVLMPFFGAKFSQALRPTADLNNTFGLTVYGAEETKPVWIPFTGITWRINESRFDLAATGGAHCVRAAEYAQLDAFGLHSRPDNSRYYQFLSGVSGAVSVRAGANGTALLTAKFQFDPGSFRPHFPHTGSVVWNGSGEQVVVDDLVDATQSGLQMVNPLAVDYARNCAEIACGATIPADVLAFQATNQFLAFTPDGGLQAAGKLQTPAPLRWGWISLLSAYAQRTLEFTNANYLMPGTFLRGGDSTVPAVQRPSELLFTGVIPSDLTQLERPDNPGYANGFADYAGLNFRAAGTGIQAESVIAGKPSGLFTLADFSKYYVRQSGVSGIHQAKDGTFPKTLTLYGYKFTFSNYGLSYLSQINVDSRVDGSVYVPYPSDFTQDFNDLKVTCLGALSGAKVPDNEVGLKKLLSYWTADFITDAIAFDRKADQQCNPADGVLTLGVEAYAQHISKNLSGILGFWPNGQLITYADCQGGTGPLDLPFDSRFKLPNSFTIKGPGTELYNATPVNDAYLNNYADDTAGPGWMNVAAKLDVPFFEDLKVHIHTSPSLAATNASLYLMGGWPDRGFGNAAHNFFTENPSDTSNHGFPVGPGVTVDNYRMGYSPGSPQDDLYRPRAQKTWIEVVHFDYPLAWSPTTHAFTSFKPVQTDIVVLSVKHQIQYMSAKKANIKFGAQFDLSPTADLANLAFDQLGGLESAFEKEISTQVVDKGLNSLNEMLDADIHKLMSGALDVAVDPVVKLLYKDILGNFDHATKKLQAGADYPTLIKKYLEGAGNTVEAQIKVIGTGIGQATGVAKEISGRLGDAIGALDEVKKLIAPDGGGDRGKAVDLIKQIASTASSILQAPDLSDKIDQFLKDADPTLNDITTVLNDLEKTLTQAKQAVDQGLGIGQEIQSKVDMASAQIHTAITQVETDIKDIFGSFKQGLDDPFTSMSEKDLEALIRQKIEDRLYASVIGDIVHHAIQQQFYDLNSSIREGMDTIMAQINDVIHNLLSEVLTGLSDEVSNVLGEDGGSGGIPSGVAAAGQIDGYAHIVGDSLEELRLDIKADLKVPSEMKFHGYLLIRELNSQNTPAGCIPGGGDAVEVKIGADDVKCDFIDPDLRVNVMAKFTFATSPKFYPAGFGAGFEILGPLSFDAFTINELGAQMAFGETENYFSGDCAVEFNGYKGKGGIFFGKTCTLDPFFWDKDVQSIIGTPPFTGVYVYGEIWIPLSEALLGIPATCFFEVSAGIGAGAGYFVEGPTYIGKMYLGVSGSLLCILSVEGDVHLVAVKNAQGLALKGGGDLSASLGPCPFCISFSKSFGLTYQHGSWSVDF